MKLVRIIVQWQKIYRKIAIFFTVHLCPIFLHFAQSKLLSKCYDCYHVNVVHDSQHITCHQSQNIGELPFYWTAANVYTISILYLSP